MSAYMIDTDHMIVLAVWAKRDGWTGAPPMARDVARLARDIHATNTRSLQERYPNDWDSLVVAPPERVNPAHIPAALDVHPLVVYMLSREAEYQCCEFEGWDQTPGGKLINEAAHAAASRAARDHCQREFGPGWPRVELPGDGPVYLMELAQ